MQHDIHTGKILEIPVSNLHMKIIACWKDKLTRLCKLNPLWNRGVIGNIRGNSLNDQGPTTV